MNLEFIISNISQGKRKGERQLFEISADRLLSVALRYVHDESTARDVIQESYIKIYTALPKFQYQSEAETWSWMIRITSREALRWISKQKKTQYRKWLKNQEPERSVEPDHPLAKDEMYRLLRCLSSSERLAFNMFAIEGFSHQEVATELNIAESSSRSLVTRARRKLQAQLEKIRKYEQQQS